MTSSWVKSRWDWVFDTENTKRRLQHRDSLGWIQTSWRITFFYSIVPNAMSSSCSAHQRRWCRSFGKWFHDGLLWWWPSYVRLSIQQPQWGPSCLRRHQRLLKLIMARGQWRVWCHSPKRLWPCSLCGQDVLRVGGEPSVDSLMQAHQQASLVGQGLADLRWLYCHGAKKVHCRLP